MRNQSHYEKMTASKVEPLIVKLAIPTIISMLITNIYNLADTAFVGTLGTSASGAVGVVFGFMTILQAVGFLFGQGAGSIIARRLGGKDIESANRAASTGIFCSISVGIIVAVLCFVAIDPLVRILGSTETIAPFAKTYITYILISMPFATAGFSMNNIFRFEGRAFLGMIGLMSGAVLNIIGDAIFMFGLDMGIAGAGLSTCLSQVVSFGILFTFFMRGKSQCTLSPRYITLRSDLITDIVGNGMPSLIRQGVHSLVVIAINMEAAVYGDAAVAAMSIVSRIVFFVFAIALGIGQGFQPVCGFNYGAKKFTRVRRGHRFALILSEVVLLVLSIPTIILAPQLVAIFQSDPVVIEIGTRALILQILTQLMIPISVLTEMSLQSTGQKLQATTLSSLKAGLIFIPVLLFMAQWRGLAGIQEAQSVADFLVMIPVAWFTYKFFKKLPKVDG